MALGLVNALQKCQADAQMSKLTVEMHVLARNRSRLYE
jgi:hypothetical protein